MKPSRSFFDRVCEKLGAGESLNPYTFVGRMWEGVAISNILCLLMAVVLFIQQDVRYYGWIMTSALLTCGPMAMLSASISLLPNTRRRHIFTSVAMGMGVLLFSTLVLSRQPMVVGFSLWLMLLVLAFQSRMHETREIGWTQHEDNLAIASSAAALGAYELIPVAPWLIIGLLVLATSLHRAILWKTLRTQKMAVEQHACVWPRICKQKSTSEFWASIIFYVTVHREGIPPHALRHTLTKLDMNTLLAYFSQESVLLYPDSQIWNHRALSSAVKEQICAMDERAVVVFELYGKDTRQAADLIKDMRSGKSVEDETVTLPDLGSAA